MVRNILLKILLSPVALLFGIALTMKNLLYKTGFLKGVRFSIPIINVGNLTVGGAGKSPHIEYLTNKLKNYVHLGIMSRGYKRKTRGFLLADLRHSVEDIGDESLQFKRKFPDVAVAVSESRALGIPKLIQNHPQIQVILLDDAYQHRSVEPHLNILLTEFDHLYTKDFLMPVGRLREWRSAAKRADIIVVTKCPPNLHKQDTFPIVNELKLLPQQQLFFSLYRYKPVYPFLIPGGTLQLQTGISILLICAIARTQYLLDFLQEKVDNVKMLEFEDHHDFSRYDLEMLKKYFINMEGQNNIILTTEKDAVRLEKHKRFLFENKLPVYVLPVEVEFLFEGESGFEDAIKSFLLDFKV